MTEPVTILCVDDEKIVLDTLKSQINFIFEDNNGNGNKFHYEIAENAEEAFEILDELNEDHEVRCLILSDYLMPVIRGDEFLMKVHKKFPKTVKILLTGQMEEDVLNELKMKLPLHRCLPKPWTFEAFSEAVESGMDALLKM